MGIKNLKHLSGFEWHPNFNPFNFDPLPKQMISKTTYDTTKKLEVKFGGPGTSIEDFVKEANKGIAGGFSNKREFWGMSLEGVKTDDSLILCAIGRITSDGDEEYNILLESIPEDYSGEGTARGSVLNALTGAGVAEGISLIVRKGINDSEGEIVAQGETSNDGSYSFDLDAGNYTIYGKDDREVDNEIRYYEGSFVIKVLGGITISNQNGVITPIIPDGQLRIILRWGEYPRDLDSHLTGPMEGSSDRFHIYYSNHNYYNDGILIANLDVDDTSSWGPETTTVYSQTDGIYRFYIHDYTNRVSTNSSELGNSGAFIEVYMGGNNEPLATYHVPNRPGTLWYVFEYDSLTGEIRSINTMTYTRDPGSIGNEGINTFMREMTDEELIIYHIFENHKDGFENEEEIDSEIDEGEINLDPIDEEELIDEEEPIDEDEPIDEEEPIDGEELIHEEEEY